MCPFCCIWFCLSVTEHQHTYFGYQENSGTENIRQDKDPVKIWTLTVTLTSNTTIQFLHKTLQNQIWLHKDPIKFGRKESNFQKQSYLTQCDFDPEDSKPMFFVWNSDPWWCITTPSSVTKGSAVEKIWSKWKTEENSEPMMWPWPWTQYGNAIFSQDNPAYDDVPSKQSLVADGPVV